MSSDPSHAGQTVRVNTHKPAQSGRAVGTPGARTHLSPHAGDKWVPLHADDAGVVRVDTAWTGDDLDEAYLPGKEVWSWYCASCTDRHRHHQIDPAFG